MNTYLDCYPCFLRQALEAARLAGAGEAQQYRVLVEVAGEMRQFKLDSAPPEMAHRIHRITRRTAHNHDPYRKAKQASTRKALPVYPGLKALVAQAKCPVIAQDLGVPVKSVMLKQERATLTPGGK
jgi:uncharacterized protein with ATP-grasp and redox domains